LNSFIIVIVAAFRPARTPQLRDFLPNSRIGCFKWQTPPWSRRKREGNMTNDNSRLLTRLSAISAGRASPAADQLPGEPPTTDRPNRNAVHRFALVLLPDRTSIDCLVTNLSAFGARLVLPGAQALPETLKLKMLATGELRRARLAWQRGCDAGLSFSIERKPAFGSGEKRS
jgi:hypothetical protein